MKRQGIAGVVVAAGVAVVAGVGSGVAVAAPAQPGTTGPVSQPGTTSPATQPGTVQPGVTNPGATTGGGGDDVPAGAAGGGQPGTTSPATPVDQAPVETTPAPVDTTPVPAETTTEEPTVAETTAVFTDPGYGQDQPVATAAQVTDPEPVEAAGGGYTDATPVEQPDSTPVVEAPVDAGPADGVGGGGPVAEAPSTDAPVVDVPVDPAPAGEHPEEGVPADTPVAPPVLGTGEVTATTPAGRVAVGWVTVPYRTVVTTTATNAQGQRVDVPEVTVGTWHDGGVDYAAGGDQGFVAAPPVVAPVVDAAVATGEHLGGVVPACGDYRVGDETLGGSVTWDNQPDTASI